MTLPNCNLPDKQRDREATSIVDLRALLREVSDVRQLLDDALSRWSRLERRVARIEAAVFDDVNIGGRQP